MQIGETGDGYHWYPIYSADGGYAFARNEDGSYDVDDMGVGKEGSIAAGDRLQQLVNDGILSASVTYDIARETFAAGGAPYFITGPWQIPEQTEALGDKLMVCPVPNWEGSEFESQPFLGVRVFFQPAKAPNSLLASTFLNDAVMTTDFMDGMYSVDPRRRRGSRHTRRRRRIRSSRGSAHTAQQASRCLPSRRWATCSPTSDSPSTRSHRARTRRRS